VGDQRARQRDLAVRVRRAEKALSRAALAVPVHHHFDTLRKNGHIKVTEGQFVAVAIVSDEIREGVTMANFNYPSAPANAVCHAVPDPVTNNYRYKLGRGVVSKMGESPYKRSFTSMSLKPRNVI
jgi:arsenite oxidase large subunit